IPGRELRVYGSRHASLRDGIRRNRRAGSRTGAASVQLPEPERRSEQEVEVISEKPASTRGLSVRLFLLKVARGRAESVSKPARVGTSGVLILAVRECCRRRKPCYAKLSISC